MCWMKSSHSNPTPDALATSGHFPAPPPPPPCLGEFVPCPDNSGCVIDADHCGKCASPEAYLCPSDQTTCVASAAAYTSCPGLKGTHFDDALPVEKRLDYLVSKVSLADQIAQLTNKAPAIPAVGVPAYNWLDDDQHGVARTSKYATVLPNGCGLGATWSKPTLHAGGAVDGTEARGLHREFLNSGNRGAGCNGCGITIYGPNLNLVRDPRWGRAVPGMRSGS